MISSQPMVDSAWALQILPDIHIVSNVSSSKLAVTIRDLTESRLKQLLKSNAKKNLSQEPDANPSFTRPRFWDLHPIPPMGVTWQNKFPPLAAKLKAELRTLPFNKYRLNDKTGLFQPGDILVQYLMRDEHSVGISFTELTASHLYWNRPLPWIAGHIVIGKDTRYPAESYKKCKEILHHLRIPLDKGLFGKRVVELGASPGGWTTVLLEAGATVTSVDWADLGTNWLQTHPNLTHKLADARYFDPLEAGVLTHSSDAIDYLFADLAAPPDKSLAALDNWIKNRWTRSFAWTFKFGFYSGNEYAPVIHSIRNQLKSYGPNLIFSIRHIYSHENEIVVLGGWTD